MFYDLDHLKSTLNIKTISKFIYGDNKYSAFLAKDKKTLLVRSFNPDKTIPYFVWLETIYNGFYFEDDNKKHLEVTEKKEIDFSLYLECLYDSNIDDAFIFTMGIPSFEKEYKKHQNIKSFDYTKFREVTKLNPYVDGLKNILFYERDGFLNVRVKNGRWKNIEGGKNTGAFFESNKKSETLLLVEGLKDGINSDIGFENVDVLATDGKNQPYYFKEFGLSDSTLDKYKLILFLKDRDVTDSQMLKMLSTLPSLYYDKVKIIDWSFFDESLKDVTDILRAFYEKDISKILDRKAKKSIGICKSKSIIRRKVLPLLKKSTFKDPFTTIYNKANSENLTEKAQVAIERKDLKSLHYIVKQKNNNNFNLDLEARYIIGEPIKSDNEFTINLNENKRLSDFTNLVIDKIKENHIINLDSPTGTGKSYVVKKEFTNHFKNIIYIAPLREVVNEFCRGSDFTNVSQKGIKIDEALADLNAPLVGMTTDIFFNLLQKYENEMKDRLSDVDLIVFDEQHLIGESEGFRQKVIDVNNYLMNRHSGKIVFMSGTPYIKDEDRKKVATIKVKVPKIGMENINYKNNPFEKESDFVKSIDTEVKNYSVMVYCSSTVKVREVTNLLREHNINCFSITSNGIEWNNEIVEDGLLDSNKHGSKYCVYVATTRATTGLNLNDLRSIYQYGTTYNSNTFIQLMARLRSGGTYTYITPFKEHNKLDSLEQGAKGICKKMQSLGVDKLSLYLFNEDLQDYLLSNLSLPKDKRNLEGFLNVFNEELQIIEAHGLGKLTILKDDFVFNLVDKKIDKILNGVDDTVNRKYIDRVLIDYLCKYNVSLLNEIYNLSFTIHDVTIQKSSNSELRLITDDDVEVKKEKRIESRERNKDRKENIEDKFGEYFSFTVLNKNFTPGEFDRLLELDSEFLDLDRIRNTKKGIDKLVILKTSLISTETIVSLAVKALSESDDIFTIKDLDILLQQDYPTKKRNKHPYYDFLKQLFSSELKFNDGEKIRFNNRLEVKNSVKRNKKLYYNVLRFATSFDIKNDKDFIKRESKRIDRNRVEIVYLNRNEALEVPIKLLV